MESPSLEIIKRQGVVVPEDTVLGGLCTDGSVIGFDDLQRSFPIITIL